MNRTRRFRFSQVLALVIRMEREQQQMAMGEAAAALVLTESGYSRIETGDTELTVQHIWLLSKLLQRQPRGLWRIAETWVKALESQGWTEDKRAERVAVAEMLAALLRGLPDGTQWVFGEETSEGAGAKKDEQIDGG